MRVALETEVEDFLSRVFSILRESSKGLYIVKRTNGEDKTGNFMIETGLTNDMICEELLTLTIKNYSYTDTDRDSHRTGEVWLFGKVLKPPLINKKTEIYIKLKLQGRVVCLSFHPSEFPLRYQYQ